MNPRKREQPMDNRSSAFNISQTIDKGKPNQALHENNEKPMPWSKLPLELIDIILEYAGLHIKFLCGRLAAVQKLNEKTARAIWHSAFESGWLGDYSLLPPVTGKGAKVELTNPDLVHVKSRELYHHLIELFPDMSESDPEFAMYDKHLNKCVNMSKNYEIPYGFNAYHWTPRLLNIAMRNMWMDVIGDWIRKLPYTAVFHCVTVGHIDLMRHLIDSNLVKASNLGYYDDKNSTNFLMDEAAENGHFDVLLLLHELGCKQMSKMALDYSAQHGYLDIVKWLHENSTMGCTKFAMIQAAGNGHLDVVKFLHQNRDEGCNSIAIDLAAQNGHIDVIKWLLENRTEGFTYYAVDAAVRNGYDEIVNLLKAHPDMQK